MGADGLVVRRRLFDVLSSGANLRVVAAPSGFGKTTLVRSWTDALAPGNRSLVWVALSADVATRRDFWQLVCVSAVRAGELGRDALAVLAAAVESADDPLPLAQRYLDGLGPTLLVLDAYEHLRGITDVIDQDLLRLTGAVPTLGVVVTTRASTHLTDDVHVMRGRVRVIREADLRFTADETEQLLRLHAPHAVRAAPRIVRDTHGYPLGIRAAAQALDRLDHLPAFGDTAWRRLVTDDLGASIADPALVDFVLDTSVPPYFDRELAAELSGRTDVDAALSELEWNGFGRWIPYTRERPAFQYVESIRDVFLDRLRTDDPARHDRAAGRAAAWLHRHEDHDLALGLAIDARQYDLASRICRSLVVSNPDVYTTDLFERHLRRVPRALLPRYPVLAFARGFAYTTNPGTRASAADYLRIAADHALDGIDAMTPLEAFHQHVGREVSLRYLGRSTEAHAAALDCLAYLDAMPAADRDALGEFQPMALGIMAYSLLQAGDVDRASAVVDQAATTAVVPWWRNFALAFVVGVNALNGRGPDARAALAMTDPGAWASGGQRSIPHALGVTGHAALCLDEFDHAGALRAYEGAEWLLEVAESWPFITWVLMHARLGLGEGRAEAHRVEAALAMSPRRPGLGSNLGTAALLNTLAILWLADGNVGKARPLLRTSTRCRGQLAPGKLLDRLLTGDPALAVRSVADLLAEPGHTVRSAAAVDTLGAAAAVRAGNEPTARTLLERAASRHELYGVRAHLMYLPAGDLAALRDLARASGGAASQAYLAAAVVSPVAAADAPPVLLTHREIEALRVWAVSRTRAEVATALFVSPNTVRSQLSSAYRKLGVTTKDAAIQRAVELDLLRRPAG